jgi:hypothetical protein
MLILMGYYRCFQTLLIFLHEVSLWIGSGFFMRTQTLYDNFRHEQKPNLILLDVLKKTVELDVENVT